EQRAIEKFPGSRPRPSGGDVKLNSPTSLYAKCPRVQTHPEETDKLLHHRRNQAFLQHLRCVASSEARPARAAKRHHGLMRHNSVADLSRIFQECDNASHTAVRALRK